MAASESMGLGLEASTYNLFTNLNPLNPRRIVQLKSNSPQSDSTRAGKPVDINLADITLAEGNLADIHLADIICIDSRVSAGCVGSNSPVERA